MKQRLMQGVDHLFFIGILLVPIFLMVASIVLITKFGIEPLIKQL